MKQLHVMVTSINQKLMEIASLNQKRLAIFWACFFALLGFVCFICVLDPIKSYVKLPLELLVLFTTASFNGFYWQFNHVLNLMKDIAHKLGAGQYKRLSLMVYKSISVEQPFDVWMGIAIFVLSLIVPLILYMLKVLLLEQLGLSNYTLETLLDVFNPVVSCILAMIILGFVRGLHSQTAIMWMGMHSLVYSITVLYFLSSLPNVHQCIDKSLNVTEHHLKVMMCLNLSQYWFDKWLNSIFAFIAIFGGALLASYTVDKDKFGWQSNDKQYQNLSFLFTISAVIIIFESIFLLGIPLMNDILSVNKF